MSIKTGGYTEEVARLARSTSFSDLPQSTVHATRRLILDTMGCILGATALPSTKIVQEIVESFGGAPESTVLISGTKAPSPLAAYINGHAANALDAEETTFLSGHISGSLVPPSLALAERQRSSGEDFIAAVAVGYEVAARVGSAAAKNMSLTEAGEIRMSPVHGHSWTVFGGTAAAAHLLNLDSERLVHAFGLTGMTAPMPSSGHVVVQPPPRPMSKYAMYGTYAEVAVMSALLAEKGFTSDASIFDGENGFWRIAGLQGFDYEKMTGNWGDSWLIEQSSFKLYPCCRFAHPILDMVVDLRAQHGLKADEIERIEIEMPTPAFSLGMHSRVVNNAVDAQFDVAYLVATALVGDLPAGPLWQQPKALNDSRTTSLAARVAMRQAPDSDEMAAEQIRTIGRAIRLPWRVTIRARQQSFVDERQTAQGDPWAGAAYADAALHTKFRDFAGLYLPEQDVEAMLVWLTSLEEHETIRVPLSKPLPRGLHRRPLRNAI